MHKLINVSIILKAVKAVNKANIFIARRETNEKEHLASMSASSLAEPPCRPARSRLYYGGISTRLYLKA